MATQKNYSFRYVLLMLSMSGVRERLNEEWLNKREIKILSYFFKQWSWSSCIYLWYSSSPYFLKFWFFFLFFFFWIFMYTHFIFIYINTFHISLIWTIACTCEQKKQQQQKNSHLIYSRIIISFPYSILCLIYGAPCDRERISTR